MSKTMIVRCAGCGKEAIATVTCDGELPMRPYAEWDYHFRRESVWNENIQGWMNVQVSRLFCSKECVNSWYEEHVIQRVKGSEE